MKRHLLVVLAILTASACSTINFKQNEDSRTSFETNDWHHIGILSLVEFSDPVNPDKVCEKRGWDTVRTRKGPLQVLVGLIPYVGALYSPEEASVACKSN
ncbi:MAG TPA: hypothetical protein VIH99_07240 [Bdellovibrionota bacterium]|jgi:hypothetical protein